jgi:type I restriction enzyme, S subunit
MVNVLHLDPDRIREYRFLLPPSDIRGAYVQVVQPIYELADVLEREISTLKTVRDLLLPRLISGQLDVSDLDPDLHAVV